jgi:hypothetical protein
VGKSKLYRAGEQGRKKLLQEKFVEFPDIAFLDIFLEFAVYSLDAGESI